MYVQYIVCGPIDSLLIPYQLDNVYFCFYILEKRTPDNIVSGSIQLTLSSTISGEFLVAPYHIMYSQLHEVWSNVTCM